MPSAASDNQGSRPVVLIVDGDPHLARVLRGALVDALSVVVEVAGSVAAATRRLARGGVAAVLLEPDLPGEDGLRVVEWARGRGSDVPFVCLSSDGGAAAAVRALRAGALEYLVKGHDSVERAAGHVGTALSVRSTRRPSGSERLVGESLGVRRLRRDVERCARSEAPVRIEGETGVGKELVARSIHEGSRRARYAFVAVNCGALPEALAEAELFGHVRGAYTGANADRVGLVQHAAGGTLLLDEIEDLPPAIQGKLLRLLQESEYRPVGSPRVRVADVRILTASNRSLEEMVAAGTFRADLYYRLDVLRVRVPALRERRRDVPLLIEQFLRTGRGAGEGPRADVGAPGPSDEELDRLQRHDWPGNVRELQNFVERARAVADVAGWRAGWSSAVAQLGPLDLRVAESGLPPERATPDDERAQLEALLSRHRWRREAAARELGVSRVTLWRKMRRCGLLPGRAAAS